jgi:hypothetical protein
MILLAAAGLVIAEQELIPHDEPVTTAPAQGAVRGRIEPGGAISRLELVGRHNSKRWKPTRLDKTTGEFLFDSLPGGVAYDLVIHTTDGRRIEGIDMSMPDARLARLAEARRRQLGLDAPDEHQFTDKDADELLEYVKLMKDFMDLRRVLYIHGHGDKAAMLVELMRDRDFHARRGGEVIWRVELWYFEYSNGGWQRMANQDRVLQRLRGGLAEWQKLHIEYRPELSVQLADDGSSGELRFTIPARPDASRGRPAGTPPRLKASPSILGLADESTTRPASRPGASRPSPTSSESSPKADD